MIDETGTPEPPSAPVCWLWWAAEPEEVRRELRQLALSGRQGTIGADAGEAAPGRGAGDLSRLASGEL